MVAAPGSAYGGSDRHAQNKLPPDDVCVPNRPPDLVSRNGTSPLRLPRLMHIIYGGLLLGLLYTYPPTQLVVHHNFVQRVSPSGCLCSGQGDSRTPLPGVSV